MRTRWLRASMQPATLLGLMMIAACWLGLAYVLSIEHSKTVAGATQQADNLARLFEEDIVSTFKGIDREMLLLRQAYERDPAHFDLREWTKRTAVVGGLTLQLSFVGADGFTMDTTRPGGDTTFERVYLGDREHFLAQVDGKTDDLFIGQPVTGRLSGKWTVQTSRRLRYPDGSFAGAIVASLDPGVFERFFEAVDLGPQGSVLLPRFDGVILASRGLKQVVGSQVKLPGLPSALARSPSGHYWGRGAVDGVIRMVAYRVTERFPVLVLVGLAEGYIFDSYRLNRATYLSMASIVTVLVLIAIMAGIRHQLRLDRIRDDLRHSETRARDKAGQLEIKTAELETTLQEVRRLAHHDALTGLANRNLLHQRIRDAIERERCNQEGFAVLCVDLDRFKTVNDTLGHSVGDELLRQIAERLNGCVRPVDTVARIGGDEFVVLQAGLGSADDAGRLATQILERIGEPSKAAGSHMTIGVSIGIALAPQDGMGVDRLLGNADLALYRAKAGGRNAFCFFNADIEKAALTRYRLERELPQAFDRDEFELFYQPWITFENGTFSGCEALLRWRHPERGIIGPAEFIAIAEDIGMIGRLGEWVLRRACRDAAGWPQPVKVAVNLSAAQFMTDDLFDTVMKALEASGLPPQRLELEITETLLLDDYEGTLATLHRLRDRGVSIALDDFGTGYSSLTYLRKFPFDRIKIDQTFVSEMTTRADCAAIVMAVAALGRSLGVNITADGIELQGQLMMLRAAGCTDGQGYLICHPKPANCIGKILSAPGAITSIAS